MQGLPWLLLGYRTSLPEQGSLMPSFRGHPPPLYPHIPPPCWVLICSPFLQFGHFKNVPSMKSLVCNLWSYFFPLSVTLQRFIAILPHRISFFTFIATGLEILGLLLISCCLLPPLLLKTWIFLRLPF